jgi:hypothetical protein
MFDEATVARMLDLQQRGYRLLRWIAAQADSRLIEIDQVHQELSVEEAGRQWIERNVERIPRDLCPKPEDLTAFANLFASYLVTSFDLLPTAPSHLASDCGCTCIFCAHLVAASHLQPKQITAADKARARRLVIRYIEELARETGLTLEPGTSEAIADDDAHREMLAIATYASQLAKRLAGDFTGPEVLVLWRRFAWTRSGSPKKDFSLTVAAVCQAEREVASAIAALSKRD